MTAVAMCAGAFLQTPEPASAHWTNGRWNVSSWSYNGSNIYSVIGQPGIDSLYAMDWAWEVEGLTNFANPYACNSCTSARRVFFTYDTFDGMYGVVGRASTPCNDGSACNMYFDLSERWNSTWEYRDWNWLDFRSVALHEFGHWMGASHTYDRPAPDTREPVMIDSDYGGLSYGETKRSVTLDDIQAVRAARNYVTIITADDSFEYHGLFHWVHRAAGGGWREFRCDGNGYASSGCYLRYWGAGSSVYQEVAPRGNYMNFRNVRARARFRNRTGQPASALVAVWDMETSPSTLVQHAVCNLPLDTSWYQCATPYFQYPGKMFRVEAYNNSGGTMDVDTVIFG